MDNNDEWTKLGPDNERSEDWKPAKKGDEMVGKFVRRKDNVGKNKSTIYLFEKADKSKVSVWTSAVIELRMQSVNPGDTVKIVYLGKQVNKKNGREFKNYDFYVMPAGSKKDPSDDIPF